MTKVKALFLALILFTAAPVMAADNNILTGVSQYEVTALADTEMSQIQGESLPGGLGELVDTVLGLVLSILGSLPPLPSL